ncbi:DUF1127 domain-containing protein [Pseudomonas sp. LY10J]|uniref:DUF1127 domain-containing protein n=1 Tax=Pseudomonas TaxID=286 RepID=UPI003B63A976
MQRLFLQLLHLHADGGPGSTDQFASTRETALDDEALKDLGLSRADIAMEAERPFWDDPMRR